MPAARRSLCLFPPMRALIATAKAWRGCMMFGLFAATDLLIEIVEARFLPGCIAGNALTHRLGLRRNRRLPRALPDRLKIIACEVVVRLARALTRASAT